jgi:hypothetical protein
MDTRTGMIARREVFEWRGQVIYGTIIKPIDPKNLSPRVLAMLEASGVAYVTRNSRCPCGSGKRFKACCMRKE